MESRHPATGNDVPLLVVRETELLGEQVDCVVNPMDLVVTSQLKQGQHDGLVTGNRHGLLPEMPVLPELGRRPAASGNGRLLSAAVSRRKSHRPPTGHAPLPDSTVKTHHRRMLAREHWVRVPELMAGERSGPLRDGRTPSMAATYAWATPGRGRASAYRRISPPPAKQPVEISISRRQQSTISTWPWKQPHPERVRYSLPGNRRPSRSRGSQRAKPPELK